VQLNTLADGRLEVRSAAVAETYWPKRSPELAKGRFLTSDIAEISKGLIHLRGRASDQINVAGRKVFPETIERVLSSHPKVAQCIVFGVRSRKAERGENIVACIAPRGHLTQEQMRSFAATHLPSWQTPREWWLVPEIQANGRGKIARSELREKYERTRVASR
jgi:acyl-CoA synthetase (AMP-forming)/AMP-acid ligase II